MSYSTKIPDRAPSALSIIQKNSKKYLPGSAYFILLGMLALLSAIVCFDFSPKPLLVAENEIAPQDIYADISFFFEDQEATRKKKEQVAQLQPLICEPIFTATENLREKISHVFQQAMQADAHGTIEDVQKELNTAWNTNLDPEDILALACPAVQLVAMDKIFPALEPYLKAGVLPDLSQKDSFNGQVAIYGLNFKSSESIKPEEFIIRDASGLYDLSGLKTSAIDLIQDIQDLNEVERTALIQLFINTLEPSIIPDFAMTENRIRTLRAAVNPVIEQVQKGEVLVRQGEKVTREQQLKIQAFAEKRSNRFDLPLFFGMVICGGLLSSGLLFSPSASKGNTMQKRDFIFIASLVMFFTLIAKGLFLLGTVIAASAPAFDPKTLAYAVPVAGAAGLSGLIFTTRRYLVTGLLLAFYSCMVFSGNVGLFIYYFLGAMWGTWLIARSHTRQAMFTSVVPLTIGLLALWAGCTLVDSVPNDQLLGEFISTISAGVLSMVLLFSIAPILEIAFNYTTRFRLMELLNLEQPLLQDLMLNAPGTYHHSLIVANMVEAGAKSIGAHSLICKVAALYHDIGKISKANYFIENQLGSANPHEQLVPSMSALILISHTKSGGEIGEQNKLSKEICDIIRQHHGTNIIRYFYQKALQLGGTPPKIEDFCYPGPKPQTREAGLVMLADAVEASSRTLVNPTPHRLKAHIDTVIKNINADGQLDETDLTFKDLSKIADSFNQVLRGLYHQRVVYPDQNDKNGSAKNPAHKNGTSKTPPAQGTPGTGGHHYHSSIGNNSLRTAVYNSK